MPIAVTNRAHFNTAADEWPGPTNTGVPAGTTLTPFSGNFETTSNNQVVIDLDIAGAIVVNHANVIVRRCRVIMPAGPGDIAPVFIASTASGTLLLEDSELYGSNKSGSSGIFYDNAPVAVTVRRCNIHGIENGAGILSDFDMRDTWMHDLNPAGADPHTDGIQTSPNVSRVNIIHNTIDMSAPTAGGTNSCIQFDNNAATNFDWLVENNKLLLNSSNGGACVRMPPGATGNNLRVKNNRMMPGVFGYCIPDPPNSITEWSGNVNDVTGATVP